MFGWGTVAGLYGESGPYDFGICNDGGVPSGSFGGGGAGGAEGNCSCVCCAVAGGVCSCGC